MGPALFGFIVCMLLIAGCESTEDVSTKMFLKGIAGICAMIGGYIGGLIDGDKS